MEKLWICLLLLMLLTGCGAVETVHPFSAAVFTSAEEVYAVDRQETYEKASGKTGKYFNDLEALAAAADEIVLGCAVSVEQNALRPSSGAVTEFRVQEVWKGSLRESFTITVREDGVLPPMEPDGTYLLFLEGEFPEEHRLCSPSQGRFVERNGYLFQQTWKNRKIPEAPARTSDLENAVYRLQPHPYDDKMGPPWIMEFADVDAVKAFVDASESQETCSHWIEENGPVHSGWLSDFEEASEIAAVLKRLPFPSLAEELGLPVDVYPGYGRDYIEIVKRNGEKICRITIYMEADTVEAGKYGRPVETENFDVLFDQTDVLRETKTNWYYAGQVDGYRLSFSLMGYEQEETLQFLRSMRFERLSEDNEV